MPEQTIVADVQDITCEQCHAPKCQCTTEQTEQQLRQAVANAEQAYFDIVEDLSTSDAEIEQARNNLEQADQNLTKHLAEQAEQAEPEVDYRGAKPDFVRHQRLETGSEEQPIAILSIARFQFPTGKENNKPTFATTWLIFLDSELILSPDFTHATFDPVHDSPVEVSQMIISDLVQVATGQGTPPPEQATA